MKSMVVKNIKQFRVSIIAGIAVLASGCSTTIDKTSAEVYKNLTAQQILTNGENALAKRSYKDATKYFEAMDALYPFSQEAQQTQLDVIYSYYKSDEVDSAISAANRYIQLYPRGVHTDYAYYLKGVINEEHGRTWYQKWRHKSLELRDTSYLQQAFLDFSDLIKLFPDSKYVTDASKRLVDIRYLLAEHELSVANYYLSHKAYVAAANRASYIVQHIPGAPQTVAALKIMVKSYRELGATVQANEALRVLQMNYPQEKV